MPIEGRSKLLSYLFVSIQFGGMAAILFTGSAFATNKILLLIEILGILLALWAIFVMQISNLNVFPDIKQGAVFVSKGPYKLIRHPMYLSIIFAFTPLVVDEFSYLRLVVILVIYLDLFFKLNYEEMLLKKHFINYDQYCLKTYRLIPFIY